MATINTLPLLTNIIPARVCLPVTCQSVPGATYRLPLSTVIALGKGNIGYTGSRGGAGPSGPQGFRGFTGSAGPSGNAGLAGARGSTGTQGIIGFTGSAAASPIINLSTVTNPILPYSSDLLDLGAYNKSWRSVYTNELFVNTGNIKDLRTGLPIVFGTTGGGGNGFTGSAGGRGFTGSNGSTGPQGPVGFAGFTGSAGIPGMMGYAGSGAPSLLAGNGISFTTFGGAIVINSTGFNTTGTQGILGYTGSKGSTGSTGTIGFTGSAGIGGYGFTGSAGSRGFTGSNGNTGPQGPIGFAGFTGSAGTGGIQIYEEDRSIGLYTALNFVGLSVTASTQTSNIATITISGTGGGAGYTGSAGIGLAGYTGSAGIGGGGTGYTGSAGIGFTGSNGNTGPQGPIGFAGYTGSAGIGLTGYTGSAGIGGGGTGTGYTGSIGFTGYTGSAGTGGIQIYEEDRSIGVYTALNFIGLSVTASTQTSNIAAITISGTGGGTGYTGSAGIGSGGTGYTGSAGIGLTGYTGSAGIGGGGAGYTGSAGVVNTLATGTYTISTLNVTNLVVSSVGAANIQSGNDLNLKAVGQITVNAPFVLTTATTSTLTSLSGITQQGAMVFVTDASGGAQPCYFDGVHWYTVNGRVRVD